MVYQFVQLKAYGAFQIWHLIVFHLICWFVAVSTRYLLLSH